MRQSFWVKQSRNIVFYKIPRLHVKISPAYHRSWPVTAVKRSWPQIINLLRGEWTKRKDRDADMLNYKKLLGQGLPLTDVPGFLKQERLPWEKCGLHFFKELSGLLWSGHFDPNYHSQRLSINIVHVIECFFCYVMPTAVRECLWTVNNSPINPHPHYSFGQCLKMTHD